MRWTWRIVTGSRCTAPLPSAGGRRRRGARDARSGADPGRGRSGRRRRRGRPTRTGRPVQRPRSRGDHRAGRSDGAPDGPRSGPSPHRHSLPDLLHQVQCAPRAGRHRRRTPSALDGAGRSSARLERDGWHDPPCARTRDGAAASRRCPRSPPRPASESATPAGPATPPRRCSCSATPASPAATGPRPLRLRRRRGSPRWPRPPPPTERRPRERRSPRAAARGRLARGDAPRPSLVRRRLAAVLAAGILFGAEVAAFAGTRVVLARFADTERVRWTTFATGTWSVPWYSTRAPRPTRTRLPKFNSPQRARARRLDAPQPQHELREPGRPVDQPQHGPRGRGDRVPVRERGALRRSPTSGR